jgi:simple sugar transport system permease protein
MYIYTSIITTLTPILLASLGGLLTLQAGVLNISQEGSMLVAAFFAILGSYMFSSFWMGLLFAFLAALVFNLIYAFFSVTLKANIWVVGMALNILASSLTILLLKSIFGVKGSFTSDRIQKIPVFHIGFKWLFFINDFSLIVWFAVGALILTYFVDSKTVFGFHIKAAGKNYKALNSSGISTDKIRYYTILINALFTSFAGSYLSIGYLSLFNKDMTAGRGWIAVAAVIFGDGDFKMTVLATLIFGIMEAIGILLQNYGINSNLTMTLPYLIIIFTLIYRGIKTSLKMKNPS